MDILALEATDDASSTAQLESCSSITVMGAGRIGQCCAARGREGDAGTLGVPGIGGIGSSHVDFSKEIILSAAFFLMTSVLAGWLIRLFPPTLMNGRGHSSVKWSVE